MLPPLLMKPLSRRRLRNPGPVCIPPKAHPRGEDFRERAERQNSVALDHRAECWWRLVIVVKKLYRFRFPGQVGGLIMPPSG